jgi:hypothetical protein
LGWDLWLRSLETSPEKTVVVRINEDQMSQKKKKKKTKPKNSENPEKMH